MRIRGVEMSLHVAEEEKRPLYEMYRKERTSIDKKEMKRINRPITALGKIISFLLMVLSIFALWLFTARAGNDWYALGGLMFIYLLLREIFALLYRPCKDELTKEYTVTAIITCYNENPESIVAIFENILALDYPVHEVLFLDDGSKSTLAYEVAKSFAEEHKDLPNMPEFEIVHFQKNRGKRNVLIDGFKMAKGDYVFLLDSDSEIATNALTELLRPFENEKTTSVVGNINILNKSKNFLTRIQSVTYFSAFQLGRAAQSATGGNVVVCSGAFSVHKKNFVFDYLDEFDSEKLMGITVSSGDDRSLTSFSKRSGGKTRYQSTAYCETIAPDTWWGFQKQRRRWQRSKYIGVVTVIRDMFPKKLLYIFWSFTDAYLWLVATVIFAVVYFTRGFNMDMRDVILYHCIISYKQNIFFMLYRPIRFLFSPIYLFAYGLSLTYTRIHAAITIRRDDWGTRVETEKIGFLKANLNAPYAEYISLAEKLLEEDLDKVIFMPAEDSSLDISKTGEAHSALEAAMKDYSKMYVGDVILKNDKELYEPCNLELIEKNYENKNSEFYFIMAVENYKKSVKLKEYNKAKNKYKFITYENNSYVIVK